MRVRRSHFHNLLSENQKRRGPTYQVHPRRQTMEIKRTMSKKSLLNTCMVCKGQGYTRRHRFARKVTCTACGGSGTLVRWIIPTTRKGVTNE